MTGKGEVGDEKCLLAVPIKKNEDKKLYRAGRHLGSSPGLLGQ